MSPPRRARIARRSGLVFFAMLGATAPPAAAGPWWARFLAAGPVPAPHDTLEITAAISYRGQSATGRGYVYLAPGHARLTAPVIAVEGFDIDNAMDWDELYTLLNQEGVIESLRTRGLGAVVLDFTDATDYIQRNAFVFTELLRQVEDAIDASASVAVVGASMGGLAARYGLAWLESAGAPHRVRSFISFDAPHAGANIPLGIQHWTDFFAGQSADAAFFRDRLNTPAARQMLVYHFAVPQSATPQADSLYDGLQADLPAAGAPRWCSSTPRRWTTATSSRCSPITASFPPSALSTWRRRTCSTTSRAIRISSRARPSTPSTTRR